jgi:glycosyltransferase involved in cell wall biosynthesis
MNVISISTDRKIFEEESSVRARMVEYGRRFDELHIVIFTRRSKQYSREQISPNVWIYPTQSLSKFFYNRNALAVARKIIHWRTLNKHNTVVTTQDPFETGRVGRRLHHSYGFGLQVQVHTDFLSPYFGQFSLLNKIRIRMAKRVLPLAAEIRVVSGHIKRSLVEQLHIPESKIDILPIYTETSHTVSTAPVYSKEAHQRFTFTILMVGRLAPEKNIGFAIDVMSEVVRKYPKAGLVIVGDGSEKANIQKKIKKLHMEQHVELIPWQNNLEAYYKQAHVFLHTSYYEGYGLVLVEAALHRLPIITSDVGIAGDILQNNKNAMICPVNDRRAFIEKLFHLIEDNSLRMKLATQVAEDIVRALPSSKESYLTHYQVLTEKALLKQ